MNKRILLSIDNVISDVSSSLGKYNSVVTEIDYVAERDFIYIGARFPFNSLFVKVAEENVFPSNMSVDVFSGNGWMSVVDLIDQTQSFSQSGNIIFTPNRDSGWALYDTDKISGLESLKIYDRYWIRLSFDAGFICSLSWVGRIFSDDNDLASEYPDLAKTSVLSAFKSGKTNWEEQHAKAAEIIEQDLAINNAIIDSGQILNLEDFKLASVQKTAEIIFNAFGDDFIDQRKRAREEYQKRLSAPNKKIDKNNNGVEDNFERRNVSTGWLSR